MKVLFVSSYKIRCGIASFTDTLESLLQGEVDYDVFVLDQFVLRNAAPNVNRVGDQAIKRLCDEVIPKFDVINLQWEPGLLGLTLKQILRRTKMIFGACIKHKKHLVVTAHTVLVQPVRPSLLSVLYNLRKDRNGLFRYIRAGLSSYVRQTNALLRWVDREGKLTLVAHTARDRRFFCYVVGLKRVVDHPLSYMRAGWVEQLVKENGIKRQEFENIAGTGKKFVVVYGFLSDYKGVETAINSMRYLPDDYVLLIYGGVHNANFKKFQKVNPYVEKLMKAVEGDREVQERIAKLGRTGLRPTDGEQKDLFLEALSRLHEGSRPLTDRVFFVEAPDDFNLARVVSAADVCVLPHLEVGQSASGVASQAIELGKRTLLSRTRTFSELDEYFANRIEFFEIGNALQLSQGISRLMSKNEVGMQGLPYTNATQAEFYKETFQWR